MLFIHPMWDHENQRLGMYTCSPRAYKLHSIGEFVAVLGLLTLFVTVAWIALVKDLSWWWLAIPFGVGIVSEALVQFSWALVARQGFNYDFRTNEATWDRDGRRIAYRSPAKGGPQEVPGAGDP